MVPREFPFSIWQLLLLLRRWQTQRNLHFCHPFSVSLFTHTPTQNACWLGLFHSFGSQSATVIGIALKRSFYFFSIKFYGFIIHKRNTMAKRSSSTHHLLLSFRSLPDPTMKNRYVIPVQNHDGMEEEPKPAAISSISGQKSGLNATFFNLLKCKKDEKYVQRFFLLFSLSHFRQRIN